ncbi:MAG: hypothetical protein ACO1OT_05390 [Heyndrickxia sp.]
MDLTKTNEKNSKIELEKTVQLKPLSELDFLEWKKKGHAILKFNSFVEANNYFQSIFSAPPTTLKSSIEKFKDNGSPVAPIITNSETGTGIHYVDYVGAITSTSGIVINPGSLGTVAINYIITARIGYAYTQITPTSRIYTSRSFVSTSSVAGETLAYQGIGTASGTPNFYSFTSNSGEFSGLMQGVATINNSTFSFAISVSGSYRCLLPGLEPVSSLDVTHSLNAHNSYSPN